MSDNPNLPDPSPGISAGQDSATIPKSLDIQKILTQQAWMICFVSLLGMLVGTLYWANVPATYESKSIILLQNRDVRSQAGENSNLSSTDRIHDEVLSNHMIRLSSAVTIQRVVQGLDKASMPSLLKMAGSSSDNDISKYVSENLTVTKGGQGAARTSKSLNVYFRHSDPAECRIILSAIITEYETSLKQQMGQLLTDTVRLMTKMKDTTEEEIRALEAEYISQRKNAPVIYTGEGGSNPYVEQYNRISEELTSVEMKHSEVSTRLKTVQESTARIIRENGSPIEYLALIDTSGLQRLQTFSLFSTAQTVEAETHKVTRLKTAEIKFNEMAKLRAEISRFESDFGPSYPLIQNLRNQLSIMEELVSESDSINPNYVIFDTITPDLLIKAYTGFLREDLVDLEQRQSELKVLQKIAEDRSKSLIEFELQDKLTQGEITRQKDLYNGMLLKIQDLDTASSLSGYIHEIMAIPEDGIKVWPKLPMSAAAGLFAGLILGCAIALLNDQLDNRFRSPSEIDYELSLPVIAQLTKIRKARSRKTSSRFIVDAQAPEAEPFRLVRTYMLKEIKSGNTRIGMITSSQPKDGKSTVTANLSVSLAEAGFNILLIDGDMRAPTMHRFLGMPINKGLSEVLGGRVAFEDAVRISEFEGLSFLSAGSAVRNPAELLQSERFDLLLEKVKSMYDFVMIDSGPLLLVSDPSILIQKVDLALLVIRPAIDTKAKVYEAVRRLRISSNALKGCLINSYGSTGAFGADASYSSNYYGGYGYGYGYGNRGYGRRFKEEVQKKPSSQVVASKLSKESSKS